jgi:hypothetical protein
MFKDLKQLGFLSRDRMGISCALVGAFRAWLFSYSHLMSPETQPCSTSTTKLC